MLDHGRRQPPGEQRVDLDGDDGDDWSAGDWPSGDWPEDTDPEEGEE